MEVSIPPSLFRSRNKKPSKFLKKTDFCFYFDKLQKYYDTFGEVFDSSVIISKQKQKTQVSF